MFDVDRILAIPDESVDYLQMGISGGERAALKDRGFVRKDGIKAKDYMIRTIQKTEKNKAKAEKAIIKGDKPLAEAPDKKELEQRLRKINEEIQTPYLVGAKFKPLVVSNPDRFESLSKEAKEINKSLGNKKREFYESTQDQASRLLRMPAARHKKYVEDALKSGKTVPDEVLKDYPDLSKKYSQSPSNRGLAITDKKGFQSEGSAAKKIKGAIANQRSKKPVETTPKKSNKQKSDQASRLVEKTRKAYDQAVDKVSRLSDELSELRSQAQDGKSKVATGRTKKRASEMTNAMKFNAALEAEAMNNGEAIPVMRKKANKNQMASLNDRINQKEIEQADALSRVNQLKTRANKLYNASVDYANKPDTATTSATPKSRKVVKGMSPRDRGIPPAASQFIKESSKNHTVFYNGKAVSMDYLGKKPKDEFKFAGMRIADNLSTGGVGFIKTPKGEYYQVSTANRSAKKVSEKEVLDSVRQSKPKQQSAAQKMNMTDAEYAAFKKKVKRL